MYLLVTQGTAGDVLPFVRIGATLAARGHEVTLITHAPFAGLARSAGLGFVSSDTGPAYLDQLAATGALLDARRPDDIRRVYEHGGLFAQTRHEVDTLVRLHRPHGTVLVGRHTSALSVLLAAEVLGAPAAWVALAPTQLLVAPVARALLAKGLAPGLAEIRAGLGLPRVHDWVSWSASADLTVGLWPRWFDQAGPAAPDGIELTDFVVGDAVFSTGGAPGEAFSSTSPDGSLPDGTLPDDASADSAASRLGGRAAEPLHARPPAARGAIPNADRTPRTSRPVIVTGGTGRLLDARFYPAAITAAVQSGHPVIVVTPHRDLLPEALPQAVTWHAHLPFTDALPHAAAIVHHGGIGTAVRALHSGVPQLILAHGADRPDNAARLAAAALARWLPINRWTESDTRRELTAAIADHRTPPVMDDEAGPTAAARAIESLRSTHHVCHGGPTTPRPADVSAPPSHPSADEMAERISRLGPEQRRRLAALLRDRPVAR